MMKLSRKLRGKNFKARSPLGLFHMHVKTLLMQEGFERSPQLYDTMPNLPLQIRKQKTLQAKKTPNLHSLYVPFFHLSFFHVGISMQCPPVLFLFTKEQRACVTAHQPVARQNASVRRIRSQVRVFGYVNQGTGGSRDLRKVRRDTSDTRPESQRAPEGSRTESIVARRP